MKFYIYAFKQNWRKYQWTLSHTGQNNQCNINCQRTLGQRCKRAVVNVCIGSVELPDELQMTACQRRLIVNVCVCHSACHMPSLLVLRSTLVILLLPLLLLLLPLCSRNMSAKYLLMSTLN